MVIQREDGECSKNALNEDTDRVPSTIIACCVLHNICLLANDDTDVDPVDSDVDGDGDQGDANDVGSRRLVLKKNFFCVGEYAEYGFDQQGWYGMFVACGIWCLADVSSVSPSSE